MPKVTGWDGVNSIKRSIYSRNGSASDLDISCNSSDDDKSVPDRLPDKRASTVYNLKNENRQSGSKQYNRGDFQRRGHPNKKRKTVKAKLNFSKENDNIPTLKDENDTNAEQLHNNNHSPLFFVDDEPSEHDTKIPTFNVTGKDLLCAQLESNSINETQTNDEVNKNNVEICSPILKLSCHRRVVNNKKRRKSDVDAAKDIEIAQKNHTTLTRQITDDEILIGTYSSDQIASLPSGGNDDAYISSCKVTPEKTSGRSLVEINESNTTSNVGEVTFTSIVKNGYEDSAKKTRKKKLPVDSLANRLQRLIKKQESLLSIWKHERYMASHGNFECPVESTEETLTLTVIDCKEECGMFLIECNDNMKNENSVAKRYTVILNNHFVKEVTVGCGWTFIIYKPYKMFNVNNADGTNLYHVVVNVCKFDVSQC